MCGKLFLVREQQAWRRRREAEEEAHPQWVSYYREAGPRRRWVRTWEAAKSFCKCVGDGWLHACFERRP